MNKDTIKDILHDWKVSFREGWKSADYSCSRNRLMNKLIHFLEMMDERIKEIERRTEEIRQETDEIRKRMKGA